MKGNEKLVDGHRMTLPDKKIKGKILAKKDIKISRAGTRIVIKKGEDCSRYEGSIKKTLIDNGVI